MDEGQDGGDRGESCSTEKGNMGLEEKAGRWVSQRGGVCRAQREKS